MTEHVTRRTAIAKISLALAGTWTAVFTGLTGIFALNPLRGKGDAQAINLGDLWSYGNVFQLIKHEHTIQDGWQTKTELLKFFVRVDSEGNPEVFSATCTHLGCSVNWNDETSEFECPCHGGGYAADGTVLAGPPPTSLPKMNTRIENEELLIELS